MIKVSIINNSDFNRAYWSAKRTLPVWNGESPRHYGQRWRETFKCRVDRNSPANDVYYIFDCDEDYTWFMLKYS